MVIQDGKPIRIVEADNDGKLSVNKEAIEKIRKIKGDIAVIIIAVSGNFMK